MPVQLPLYNNKEIQTVLCFFCESFKLNNQQYSKSSSDSSSKKMEGRLLLPLPLQLVALGSNPLLCHFKNEIL